MQPTTFKQSCHTTIHNKPKPKTPEIQPAQRPKRRPASVIAHASTSTLPPLSKHRFPANGDQSCLTTIPARRNTVFGTPCLQPCAQPERSQAALEAEDEQ